MQQTHTQNQKITKPAGSVLKPAVSVFDEEDPFSIVTEGKVDWKFFYYRNDSDNNISGFNSYYRNWTNEDHVRKGIINERSVDVLLRNFSDRARLRGGDGKVTEAYNDISTEEKRNVFFAQKEKILGENQSFKKRSYDPEAILRPNASVEKPKATGLEDPNSKDGGCCTIS